jgi:cytoskeletal protein RodZ
MSLISALAGSPLMPDRACAAIVAREEGVMRGQTTTTPPPPGFVAIVRRNFQTLPITIDPLHEIKKDTKSKKL